MLLSLCHRSAISLDEGVSGGDGTKTFKFEQKVRRRRQGRVCVCVCVCVCWGWRGLSQGEGFTGGDWPSALVPLIPSPSPPPLCIPRCSPPQVPIPSYLIALAVGNLESRELGPRSRVWSEPSMVEAGAYEFAETEAFIVAGVCDRGNSRGVYHSILGPCVVGVAPEQP